ncbi:MAG: hypothetical protein E3J81_08445 [Dehalococcoidia bacterium]|nr:MAG: hypothetical protein E3J81_08445 [Dehalococcoidia bacterium]
MIISQCEKAALFWFATAELEVLYACEMHMRQWLALAQMYGEKVAFGQQTPGNFQQCGKVERERGADGKIRRETSFREQAEMWVRDKRAGNTGSADGGPAGLAGEGKG